MSLTVLGVVNDHLLAIRAVIRRTTEGVREGWLDRQTSGVTESARRLTGHPGERPLKSGF
jgi:hypothetical protein